MSTGELNKKGKRLNEDGSEILDSRPMEPPVGYKAQPSLSEQIRAMVRSEQLAAAAEAGGAETFDEADDFDVPDDPIDPSTPYEEVFEGSSVRELRERADKAKADLEAAEKAQAARLEEVPASVPPSRREAAEPAPAAPQNGGNDAPASSGADGD